MEKSLQSTPKLKNSSIIDQNQVPNAQQEIFKEQLRLPQHIGFILDGNARWSQLNNLPVEAGHAKGAQQAISMLRFCCTLDIRYVTLYVLSAENIQGRHPVELSHIFDILSENVKKMRDEILENKIQFRVLGGNSSGNDAGIPEHIVKSLLALEYDSVKAANSIETKDEGEDNDVSSQGSSVLGHPFTVNLAINYGSRQDLVDACRKVALDAANEALQHIDDDNHEILEQKIKQSVDEMSVKMNLSTNNIPDPDLIIRSGGERRLSNFLLWEAAYSELYFCDTLWPDFDEKCLVNALLDYSKRDRRYGSR